MKALTLKQFENKIEEGSLILDFRPFDDFAGGYIPKSLFVQGFAKSGLLEKFVSEDRELLLVLPSGNEKLFLQALYEEGYERIAGYLEGGFETWVSAENPFDLILSIDAEEFILDLKYSDPNIVDIRSRAAFQLQHLQGADHVPANILIKELGELPTDEVYYIYCEDGMLSGAVISHLKRFGLNNYYHLYGGFKALLQMEAPMNNSKLNKPGKSQLN